MHWIKKARKDGLSLRLTFILMLVVSICLTAVLLVTAFRTIRSFYALSSATDRYIDLQEAADSLLKASDYLTEEVQCYTVIGDRAHLDNYFTEAEVTCRREKAIETMDSSLPDSEALKELKGAMNESLSLMNREYYAMLLILAAQGDSDIPAAMQSITLSPVDLARPAAEKRALAQTMVHDDEYYRQKNTIREHLNQCIVDLKEGTHGTQREMADRMHTDLTWTAVLILIQSLSVVLLLWITTSLGINPLIRAVDHIKHDQKLPITGAHEFRYLAGTYNKMYSAYKRSIDNLSYKASHDELTGVYNRAGYDLLQKSVDLDSTAFLLIDADRFKQINDEYGHAVGDRVLQKIATTLKENLRTDDYVCRIGGDEFMVLMVHVDGAVKRLIRHKVAQINTDLSNTDDGLPAITVSVGVSMGRPTEDPQDRFRDADIALYRVKDSGGGACSFYEPSMDHEPKGERE